MQRGKGRLAGGGSSKARAGQPATHACLAHCHCRHTRCKGRQAGQGSGAWGSHKASGPSPHEWCLRAAHTGRLTVWPFPQSRFPACQATAAQPGLPGQPPPPGTSSIPCISVQVMPVLRHMPCKARPAPVIPPKATGRLSNCSKPHFLAVYSRHTWHKSCQLQVQVGQVAC